ncbi:hypothetical protein Taro_008536, partial [Colocasia esculenta]|nr:hypothetical protein [Colocasia esculenta]
MAPGAIAASAGCCRDLPAGGPAVLALRCRRLPPRFVGWKCARAGGADGAYGGLCVKPVEGEDAPPVTSSELQRVVEDVGAVGSRGLRKDVNSLPKPLTISDLSTSTSNDSKVRVAYQGFPGAFSEAAALKAYPQCEAVPCEQFEAAFKAVELWLVDKAVLPIENSLGGSIHRNYDLLLRHRLHIVGEVQLAVNHCLMALPGVRKEELKRVLSHPQALSQCENTLSKLGIIRESVDDTAGAAQFIASNKLRDAAAVASARAAEIYGLHILAEGIQAKVVCARVWQGGANRPDSPEANRIMAGPTCDLHGFAGRPRIERIRFDPIRFADPPRSASPRPLRFARRHANRDCAVPIHRSLAASPFLPHFSPFSLKETPDLHSRRPKEASYVDLKMAPKKATSEGIGWQHGTALGDRQNYKCNYCGHTGQGGGVSRLKKHLASGRLAGYHDVQGCKSVSAEVKRLIIEHLKGVRAETQRKRADRDMQERIISGRQRDDDDDDDPEIHAEYVLDVPEQRGSFEVGSGSGGSGSRVGGEAHSRWFSNVGDYFTHMAGDIPIPEQHERQRKRSTGVTLEEVDPNIYSREHGKQTRIDDAFNQQGPIYK